MATTTKEANSGAKDAPKRKKVESTFADKWEPQNPGDELSGSYLGSEEAPGKKGETFTAYHLQDDSGKKWSLAGAHLDSLFNQVPRGTYVWVTYRGMQKTKQGDMRLFGLDVAEGATLLDPYEAQKEGKE